MTLAEEQLIIFDGACGTNIQLMNLDVNIWGSCQGCNEYLNLTCPEAIIGLHKSFLDAGAMVIETNTFGASSIVLSEYGLDNKVEEINHAAVQNARQAIGKNPGKHIAGSVGPGTKLPSLGHISVDQLADALSVQMQALLEAGVDLLIIETCQDMLQVKTAIVSCYEVFEKTTKEVPVMISVTIEQQGTMLLGSEISAVAAMIEPFNVFSLGLNCATGPADMESHIRFLSHNWEKRISCMPNQGLPEVIEGKTVYSLDPVNYANMMKNFVVNEGVSIAGGCCGTTPEHIKCLVNTLNGCKPAQRSVIS